ncbi:SDR family oxidoreductase [Brachybacterium kimchii]|uniref:SDR family oxidoreductase n=1 Tax=Brachybacterium kimchii TaxID=2942909 RepID=A0ABY4N5D4_9MICO|nr:SDR family oxidoreductase [Brachybacterium kimchii]UQN28534.1 SDR family oxidoreductase [Brachybacterium kimchii]
MRTRGPSLWVTGGGSGMGRATAISAATTGWRVAISGRRREALEETAAEITAAGGDTTVLPLDVQDRDAVASTARQVADHFGGLDAVVLAAGLNTPRRRWEDQDLGEFDAIVRTNLQATASVISASLPHLRDGGGLIVVISSFAGWAFQPGAGVAYSASKTALSSLVRTLNQQEAPYGVRSCHLCPGDVATDFLEQRPQVPDAEARSVMLTADDIARAVQFVLDSPSHVRVDELVVSPVSQR